MKKILLFLAIVFNYLNAFAQYAQFGNKLVSTDVVNNAFGVQQGTSVSISTDGKTAVIGGPYDNSNNGAAWIYTFNGTGFVQMGNKLAGTGAVNGTGGAQEGTAVCISGDGKTAIVGAYADNGVKGAAWIFTSNGTNFVQAGSKLVGSGAVGKAHQGTSVSLSFDGATALVGGDGDSTFQGAAWIYTFNGSNYVQFGNKLVGTGALNAGAQGHSVSLSADGKIAILGGYADNFNLGAVWVFSFNGSNYVQVGDKLVGAGAIGSSLQGASVSASGDGKTILVGATDDNNNIGAAWIFTFNGSNYVQLGNKLVGTGSISESRQGLSVSLSSDGKTAVVGGYADNSNNGAVWVYTFNGINFTQVSNKLVATGATGEANQGSSVSISGDGKTILSGGPGDNSNLGATWVFTYTGQTLTSIKDFPEVESKSGLFALYPNPSDGTFFIKSLQSSKERSFYVDIYSNIGQYIGKFPQGQITLPKGLYFLRHEVESKKLIVN